MPVRLVYSPKAYVYTKNSAGVVNDITNYVTSGEVQRLINQASSATVTLRNPNRIFTKPKKPTFHPMDAITIFLERIKGYPVQVFTGYLDSTPYYQMFPGTVTLQATCTLKRLMYTYFDPSLPYVNSFFAYYGWIADQQGAIYNQGALGNATRVSISQAASGSVNLEDGSIGKLLYATLTDIGNWDDSHIYIEDIPSGADGLGARIGALMQNLLTQEQTAATELTTFLDGTIGSSSSGSGGGSGSGGSTPGALTGNSNAAKAYNYLEPLLGDYGAAGVVGNMMWESGGGNDISLDNSASDVGSYGIIQWTPKPSDLPVGASLATQLAYVWNELQTGYTSTRDALRNASSPEDAAVIYCHGREEPQVPLLGDESVVNWTQRKLNARAAYNAYHNNTNNSTGSSGTTNTTGPRGTTVAGGSVTFTDSSTTTSGSVSTGDSTTVYNAIVEAANAIAKKQYPYAWGGGHPQLGVPSQGGSQDGGGGPVVTGFDCSGSVSAVLGAAQLISSSMATADEASAISSFTSPGIDSSSGAVNIFYNSVHTFMEIDGRFWGTTDGSSSGDAAGGPGWDTTPSSSSYLSEFTAVHINQSVLSQSCKYSLGITGGDTIGGTSSSGTDSNNITNTASAEAFTAELDFPSIEDMSLAIMLGGVGNGLMHDQQLLPFIQQLCEASMRQFQSLPNGDFYAFFPDYFGEFDQHPAYWEIDDLEVLSGDIYLDDSSLVTHQYVVGDNTYPADAGMYNELFSTGVITIYNAFQQGMGINGQGNTSEEAGSTAANSGGMTNVMDQNEAIEFVKRYGARPQVSNYPQVRSSLYEMFLAYQEFMVAWANQFRTTFSFTFMPEIFPGGKISFPSHGIQLYVQSVTHTFDYTEGFTTDAVLTAPSSLGTNSDIPDDMVQALVKPVRDAAAADTSKPSGGSTNSSKAAASSQTNGTN